MPGKNEMQRDKAAKQKALGEFKALPTKLGECPSRSDCIFANPIKPSKKKGWHSLKNP